jgi:hypothetical protein
MGSKYIEWSPYKRPLVLSSGSRYHLNLEVSISSVRVGVFRELFSSGLKDMLRMHDFSLVQAYPTIFVSYLLYVAKKSLKNIIS